MFRADMHCHSTHSDGTCSPKELIDLAKKQNLQGLSITDHDTVSAYSQELFEYAKQMDILLVTGVEFSAHYQEYGVHILGYAFDLKHPAIERFCKAHAQRRECRKLLILKKLRDIGISLEEFNGTGRPHIAKAMIDQGYIKTFKEAFDDYIGDEAPCYAQGETFSVEETIGVIKEASGKAFLAHPILIERRGILNHLLEKGFDGLECYYAKSSIDQTRKMLRLAAKHKLKISGGSDFHGDNKAYLPLGSAFITEEHFFPLWTGT